MQWHSVKKEKKRKKEQHRTMWVHFKTSSERSQVQKRTYYMIPYIWLYVMLQKHKQWLHRGSLKWDRLEKGREEISRVMQVLCYLYWVMVMFIFSNIIGTLHLHGGLFWLFSSKESPCQCRRHGFDPWVGKIRWRRKWQPTPVFLPGKSHG